MAEVVGGASSVAIIPSAGPPGVSLRGPAGANGTNGAPGRDGVDGVNGAGVIVTRAATQPVPPWTAVISVGASLCKPADPSNPDHRGLVIGVTALGGLQGSTITIQTAGDVQGDVGTFPAGSTLFVGAGGAVTGTAPTSGWRQIVGKSIAANAVNVVLGEAQVISNDDALLLPDGGLATRATPSDVQAASANDRYLTPATATSLPFRHGAPQAMRRTAAGALGDKAVTPYDFWNLVVGGDHTAAVQAAFNNGQLGDYPVFISNGFSVTSLETPRFLRIHSAGGSLNGIATGAASSVSAILNVPADNFEVTGRLNITGGYNLAYKTGMRVYGSQTQFNFADKLAISGVQVGYTHGDPAFPFGIASETTITGLHTYGVPICFQAIGTETIVSLIGCQLVSDVFGAPSSWASLPRRVHLNIGANIIQIGGEACITDTTSGYIVEMQAMDSTRPTIEGVRYGETRLKGVHVETASPFLLARNLTGQNINQPASRALFEMEGCGGFVSQDIVMSFISDDAPIDIRERGSNFNYPGGVRTQPVWFVGGTSGRARLILDPAGMGLGFRDPLQEAVNGVLVFDDRRIARIIGLGTSDGSAGQSLTTGTPSTLYYQTHDTSGPRARFAAMHDIPSGRIYGPVGGIDDLVLDVQFAVTDATVTGRYIVFDSTGREAGSLPIVGGRAGGRITIGDLATGDWIEPRAQVSANAVTANNGPNGLGAYLNRVDLYARNR